MFLKNLLAFNFSIKIFLSFFFYFFSGQFSKGMGISKSCYNPDTYSNYHPIPVPFNIISMFLMLFPCLRMKKTAEISLEDEKWVSSY